MKIKYILAAALVAMFAIPGTASQLAANAATAPASLATASLFSDPHAAPTLSIDLPTRFTALEIGTDPLQHFAG